MMPNPAISPNNTTAEPCVRSNCDSWPNNGIFNERMVSDYAIFSNRGGENAHVLSQFHRRGKQSVFVHPGARRRLQRVRFCNVHRWLKAVLQEILVDLQV